MKKILLALVLLALLLLSGCREGEIPVFQTPSYDFEMHFLDVGQGDAILLLSGSRVILVDAGTEDKGEYIVNYLKDYGIEKIDLLALSHPHADHMGGMEAVLNAFAVDTFIMPDVVHTTAGFESLLAAIARNGCTAEYGTQGSQYALGKITVNVLSPGAVVNSLDLNNASLVLMVEYEGSRTLLTGDAEQAAEQFLLDNNLHSVDVLKVGHHGSITGTGENFLRTISPQIAVISCGAGNSYGHPHREVLRRLEVEGSEIFRTDLNGTIIVGIEKGEIHVVCQRIPQEETVDP